MYGTQAECRSINDGVSFENDVKMYGTQASLFPFLHLNLFENDVKMYGTQAVGRYYIVS